MGAGVIVTTQRKQCLDQLFGRLLGMEAEGLGVDGGIVDQLPQHGKVLCSLALQQLGLVNRPHRAPGIMCGQRTPPCPAPGRGSRRGPHL